MLKNLSALLLVLPLAAVSVAGQAASVSTLEVTAVIELAEATQQRARDSEYGWTITRDYIATARAQLAENEREEALESAQRALFTANRAVEQAGDEADVKAWQHRIPAL